MGAGAAVENPRLRTLITQKIKENPVMMFSKSYCPHCARAANLLKENGVDFTRFELDLETEGKDVHEELKAYSKQRTVPNIYIAEEHIGGADDIFAAWEKGELKEKLDKAKIAHGF